MNITLPVASKKTNSFCSVPDSAGAVSHSLTPLLCETTAFALLPPAVLV